jgi:hypothetical protein
MSYEYKHVDEMMTFSGVAWRAEIYDNHSNLICEVMNTGEGLGNKYKWHSEDGRQAMIDNAYQDFPGSMEPLDEFVHALWLGDFDKLFEPEDTDLF